MISSVAAKKNDSAHQVQQQVDILVCISATGSAGLKSLCKFEQVVPFTNKVLLTAAALTSGTKDVSCKGTTEGLWTEVGSRFGAPE